MKPPAYLREEILERSRKPDIRVVKTVYQTSRRMRFFLYSLKVGVAVAVSLFLLFFSPVERIEMSAIEKLSERSESAITEKLNEGNDKINSFLNQFRERSRNPIKIFKKFCRFETFLIQKASNIVEETKNKGGLRNMINSLLDAVRRQQFKQYENQNIYELDYRNPAVKDSEVLLVNLAAEYLGLQKTIELALACHAKVVSLILWDPENYMSIPTGGHWPRSYRTISLEQAVIEFQAKNMDLFYMRNPQAEDGNRLIRLDFKCCYT